MFTATAAPIPVRLQPFVSTSGSVIRPAIVAKLPAATSARAATATIVHAG
ncbi:hypothetical protein ACFWVM_03125 [Nocardia fluminea]